MADTREQRMKDRQKQHRRRARRRAVLRGTVIVFIAVLLFLLWQNWDVLAPDRLADRFQDLMGSGVGSFPVDVSGLTVHRVARSQQYTVMLSDSHLIYYDAGGGEVNRTACTYSSALLRTAGRYVLLAEQGGKHLQLNTRTSTLVTLNTEQEILAVAANEKGQFAVLTNGPQGYAVQVQVYDKRGNLLYTRNRNQLATDVTLSPDGKQVALLSVQAENGNLNSEVAVFSTDSADTAAVCAYRAADTLLYRMEYLNETYLVAVGESRTVMLNTVDGLSAIYVPIDRRLLGYTVGDGYVALAVRPYGSTGDGEIHVVDMKGDSIVTVPFSGEFRHLSHGDTGYLLLTDSYVQCITAAGAGPRAAVPADGQQAVLGGNKAVVLGINRLSAYDLE